jgi:hypothetical protein
MFSGVDSEVSAMNKQCFNVVAALSVLALVVVAGCARDDTNEGLELASLDAMPQEVQHAPQGVQESYQFALANPEILQRLPCYCGCGGMGHTSNYSCYASSLPGGEVQFDGHALGCSICVDITLDAMRMLKEGRALAEIRTYVDVEYSKYGPSNMPPPETDVGSDAGD